MGSRLVLPGFNSETTGKCSQSTTFLAADERYVCLWVKSACAVYYCDQTSTEFVHLPIDADIHNDIRALYTSHWSRFDLLCPVTSWCRSRRHYKQQLVFLFSASRAAAVRCLSTILELDGAAWNSGNSPGGTRTTIISECVCISNIWTSRETETHRHH